MPLGRGLSSLIPNLKSALKTEWAEEKNKAALVLPKEAAEDKSSRIWHIPLSSIKPNPHQPRQNFSHQDLEDLVNSIKEHGIIQPLLVSETEDGNYEMIAGERRFRAAQILGLPTVPAICRKVKDVEKLELALIENLQRKDLNPIEEAFAYERLVDRFGLTHEGVARRVGKSRPHVSNMVRLLALPSEIQKGLIDGLIGYALGRAILAMPTPREQLKTYYEALKSKDTVQKVVDKAAEKKFKAFGLTRRDITVIDYEQKLRDALGTKVRITKRGDRGTIIIEYYSSEELGRIVKIILE